LLQRSRPAAAATPAPLPAWLARAAPPEKTALRKTPSSALDDTPARPGAGGGVGVARLRGLLAHRLLQALPAIAPDRRARTAADYLDRAGATLPAGERAAISGQVMRVLDDLRFRELFGAHSRAEVPVVGNVETGGETYRVSGQVDRLAVTADAVLIADYKTNRRPPRRIAEVPPDYLQQLALYRAVLAKLYPDRPVRCALIWTEVPDLMELSDNDLDRALARITPA
jgi:ATP-dependent helicase/nuclease subunit A